MWGESHPYARRVGSREVAKASKADACGFFDANYLPSRAVMVVTGSFDPDALQPRIGRRFGPIARTGAAPPVPVAAAKLYPDPSEHHAPIDHPVVQIYLPAPPWGGEFEEVNDLVLAALASELNDLDREENWVVDASVGYAGDGGQRVTEISVTVTDAARLDDAVDAVFTRAKDLFQDADHDGHAGDYRC